MAAYRRWFGLLWTLIFILDAFLVLSSKLLREVSRPAVEFHNHEVTTPFVVVARKRMKRDLFRVPQNIHLEELSIVFKAFGQEYLLDLQMNKNLFPNHYMEKHHENGVAVKSRPYEKVINHCYYRGQIRDISESWAAISTCQSISGIIYDGKELLYLEPTNDTNLVFVYRKSELIPQNFTCGYSSIGSSIHNLHDKSRHRRNIDIRGPYNSNKQSRYVELVLVNDLKEYKEMKENKDAVIARSKDIANIVNALYSPLNIFIALVGVVVWSEFDQITLSKDGDTTLTNFLHYRRERLVSEIPNDNAQLITGITFEGGVVGKALKGPICTYEYSGGVNMDHSPFVGLVATTVAHELGHNFGMEHDNDECSCSDDKCIMAPSSSSTSPTHWSSCSLEHLHTAFEHGMDYCLRNHPLHLLGPVCGNGFLEDGEQCDCGLKKFCNNPCCNATSCTLFPNATCATGECCDITTCQVKSPATLCRPLAGECDLPEFCDGQREFCPDDVFKQDGVSCKYDKAFCYSGTCRSHSDQCKLLWGHSGQMSDYRCFDQNKKGTASGNCGYYRLNQTYKPCDKEDILCGMLHCTHLNERLEFGMESVAILSRSFITTGGKILTCRSAIVDLGLNSVDPGLAPDGAKCGENKVCVNQRCMSVAALRRSACPFDCNGRGVCNSKGNCHCNVGFAPPYCDSPGSGGSHDSGPASDPDAYTHIATILYILCLGIIPSMVLVGCGIYYYRKHLQMWWIQKARETAIKSRAREAAQRKKQARYGVDRNSLRNIEISCPMQPELMPAASLSKSESSSEATTPNLSTPTRPLSSNATVTRSQSSKASKFNLDRNSLRNIEISYPIPQAEVNNVRIMPVRPAPPRPTSPVVRNFSALSKTPVRSSTLNGTTRPAVVVRTSSMQEKTHPGSNTNLARFKRLSGGSLRPTNPPPRPPPPKQTCGTPPEYAECVYSEIYYDDCQNTVTADSKQKEFKEQPLIKPGSEANRIYATIGSPKIRVSSGKYNCGNVYLTNTHSGGTLKSAEGTNATVPLEKAEKVAGTVTASNTLQCDDSSGINSTSLVASLAKRFEQQDSNSSTATNVSLPKGLVTGTASMRQNRPYLAPKPMLGNHIK